MVSERKRQANRRNSRKSTGPRTARGKRICSRNALKHGLASLICPVMPFERESDYIELADAMERDLRPVGVLQREVVALITQLTWKLRRIPQIEAALLQDNASQLINAYKELKEDGELEEDRVETVSTPRLIASEFAAEGDRPYERLEMYHYRLQRSLESATRHLERLRKQTAGEELTPEHRLELLNRDMDRVMEKAREAQRLVEETLPADETAAPQDEPSEPIAEVRENRETKTDPDAAKDADRVLPNRATDCDKPGWSNDQREKKSAPERTTNAPCDAKPGHSWPGAQRDDAPPAKPSPGPEGPGFVSRSGQP